MDAFIDKPPKFPAEGSVSCYAKLLLANVSGIESGSNFLEDHAVKTCKGNKLAGGGIVMMQKRTKPCKLRGATWHKESFKRSVGDCVWKRMEGIPGAAYEAL